MKIKLIRLFISGVFVLLSVQLFAQDDVYHAEIGVNGGGSYYLGDVNSQLFRNTHLAYSGFLRLCIDPRFAAKIELTDALISGTDLISGITFKNQVLATDVCCEYNFFDLEKNEYKQFSKTFSPYIFGGFGGIGYYRSFTMSIPFGLGMKVKLGHRWNLNMQWTTRILMADNLENIGTLDNSGGLNGTNIFNNDKLSTFTVGLSFDIWRKVCDCENSSVIKDNHKFMKK